MPSRATKKANTSTSQEKVEKLEKPEEETKSGHKRQREPSQDPVYFVEAILDKKKFYGAWRYKVKWQGFSEDECTWEPAKNLESVKDMIVEFNKTFVAPKEEEEEKSAPKTATKEKMAKSRTTKTKEKDENNDNKMNKSEKKTTRMGSPKKKVKTDKPQEVIRVDCGHFKLGDHAKQITNAKKENNQVLFTIEWKAREDGKAPGNTKMTNEEIRKYDKDLLLDFYEARLKFVKPSNKTPERKSGSKSANKDKETMEEEHESKKTSPQDKGTVEGSEEHENGALEDHDNKDKKEGSEKAGTEFSEENKLENQPGETVLGGKENVVEDVENEIDDHDQPIYADLSFQVAEEMRVEAYEPSYVKASGGEQKTSLEAPKQDLQLTSPQEMSESEGEGENKDNKDNE